MIQRVLLSELVVFHIIIWVVCSRPACHTRKWSCLSKVKILYVLAKIEVCSSLNSDDIILLSCQWHKVKITLEDIFLCVGLFHVDRTEDLSYLTLDTMDRISGVITRDVLDSLLSDSRTTYLSAAVYRYEYIDKWSERSLEVNAVMRIKSLVLGVHKSVLNILRNILKISPYNVLIAVFQSIIKVILLWILIIFIIVRVDRQKSRNVACFRLVKADSCCGICKVKDVNSQNCCKYRTGDNEYQEYRQQSCA